MANEPCNWNGTKGSIYFYEVHPINVTIKADVLGNYIFARKTPNAWEAVYIGEGDLRTRISEHINNKDVMQKGATHIHLHPAKNKTESFDEETDLLLVHTEAYEPIGCNVKKGG